MNRKAVIYTIGRFLQIMGVIMLVPMGISLWDERAMQGVAPFSNPETNAFLVAILGAVLLGTITTIFYRSHSEDQGVREGFAIVTIGWVTLALFAAIPFFVWFLYDRGVTTLGGGMLAFTDAYFEMMSGFTTTGSTILTDIEALPRGLLFWRSLTHWLGGMGIITLALALFPALGVGGYHLFRGEVPGPKADRLRPRLKDTAMILWGVYVLLSGLEAALLMLCGMDWFDSLCHTFGTMATGGFSTRNASIGAWDSAAIDWVITVFMFLSGMNFLIHYRLIFKRDWSAVRENREFHFYLGTVVVATAIVTVALFVGGLPDAHISGQHFQHDPRTPAEHALHVSQEAEKVRTIGDSFRYGAFQVVSIVTTTGFGTADFDVWPSALGLLLLTLMFWGGCAGSTGGGMKMIRVLVTIKASVRELKKVVRPRLVSPLKIRRISLQEGMVANIVGFCVLFVGLFVFCSLLMSFFVPDATTAVSSVIAAIGNIGPGLAGVGSSQTFAWIPVPGKWVLILCMLLGRLEIFTVLVLFRTSFWRR